MSQDSWAGISPSRRQLLFGTLLLSASAAGLALKPNRSTNPLPKGALEKSIPATIGSWSTKRASSFVLPPEDADPLRIYDQVLTRAYQHPSGVVLMLLIAYGSGQTGLFQVHRPEACYPANGFTLGPKRTVSVDVRGGERIASGFFTASAYSRIEQLLYWTRIGTSFPTTWLEENLAVVHSNFSGSIPDGVIVRMSIISPDQDRSLALLKSFARELTEMSGPTALKVMLGPKA